jgi:hypothetical protein
MLKDEVRTLSYRNAMLFNRHLFKCVVSADLLLQPSHRHCAGTRSFWTSVAGQVSSVCLQQKPERSRSSASVGIPFRSFEDKR